MRYPHFLACNGNIGFVAPSFGCATEPYITGFKKAQERFKNLGYGIVNGPNVYEANGIGISNTPELCGQELTDMYTSDKSDVKFLVVLTGIRLLKQNLSGLWDIQTIRILHFCLIQ